MCYPADAPNALDGTTDVILETFRVVAAVCLVTLPGSWLAFGLPARGLQFWTRAACGVVLSPAAVFVQYYLLQFAGLSFGQIAWTLPVLNLPVLWIVFRRYTISTVSSRISFVAWPIVVAVPTAYLWMWMHDLSTRTSWGHHWLHADVVYMIANSYWRPEDPHLAGFRLSYPWLTDLFHGLIGYLLNCSPNSSYIWVDAAWLVSTLGLMATLVKFLGGGLWARVSSVLWLCFGVNASGSIVSRIVPQWVLDSYPIWGDPRYSPWLKKFGVFAGSALGLALIVAIAVVVCRPAGDDDKNRLNGGLLTALLIALPLSYPILFPPGALLVGTRLIVELVKQLRGNRHWLHGDVLSPIAALVSSSLVAAIWLNVITTDRVGPTMELHDLWTMKVRAATTVIVLAPMLLGVAMSCLALLRRHKEAAFMLLLTALGCVVPYVLVELEHPSNEYKFILSAAICLAPFLSIAWERVALRLRTFALPSFAIVTMIFAGPAFKPLLGPPPLGRPSVDASDFALRLAPPEVYAKAAKVIQTRSPNESVLITGPIDRNLVTVTQRPLYVPYDEDQILVGVGINSRGWHKRNLGYDPAILDRRRTILHALYETNIDDERQKSLQSMQNELRRPLIIVVDEVINQGLHSWVAGRADATLLHNGEGIAAWLINTTH